jgi:hypothetical protein
MEILRQGLRKVSGVLRCGKKVHSPLIECVVDFSDDKSELEVCSIEIPH